MRAEVVVTPGISSICTGTGVIDYALVHQDLLSIVTLEAYYPSWGPHIGGNG